MAIVRFTDETEATIKPTEAYAIWKVLNGEEIGNDKQQEFCMRVKKIYLNWRDPDCPESYIRERWGTIFQQHILDWVINGDKQPVKPEFTRTGVAEFAKKWGLWKNKQPTQKLFDNLIGINKIPFMEEES